ncbi:RELT-like protein 1 [Nibea albiflora]|uniref:RELT-like protein 1 n=1 Tax=Nibea albiflora TaxID=240163 RepID=A0ACB7EWL8_NIBAL|nr:RELT-like protein 1 [Nibea albiflora]
MAFILVPVFFLLGLLGVVICHVLKRKGYRCTTEAQEDGGEECKEEGKDLEMDGDLNDTLSENNDTVGQIVHYIMKNEANSDALKAMIHENSIDSDGPPLTPTSPGTPTPPMTPVSPGAPPGAAKHTCSHLHTIGGMAGSKNICTRCSQKKWPLMRRPSARKAEQRRSQYGEVTVLAVGRLFPSPVWLLHSKSRPVFSQLEAFNVKQLQQDVLSVTQHISDTLYREREGERGKQRVSYRFRVTKCEKTARERRTLLITDTNGSVPTSPTEVEPKSRTTSESQQVGILETSSSAPPPLAFSPLTPAV